MIKIVAYQPEHLGKLKAKKCHEKELPQTVCTRAVTFLIDENPLAIFGSFNFVPGVMHVWAIVSEEAKKYPIAFFKATKRLLEHYEKVEKPRRVQIDILEGHDDLIKWANKIGFSCEGLMKAYGPDGSNYWLFGRVNPWAQ